MTGAGHHKMLRVRQGLSHVIAPGGRRNRIVGSGENQDRLSGGYWLIEIVGHDALGPELARKPLSVRKRIEAVREAYRERLMPFVPGRTRQEKLTKFQLLFPSMAGVLTSVRMNVSPEKREELLTEARSFFIRLFAQE